MTIASTITYSGFLNLFWYFAGVVHTISIWQKNQLVYRILGIVATLLRLVYAVIIGSVVMAALELLFLFIVIGGTIRYLQTRPS